MPPAASTSTSKAKPAAKMGKEKSAGQFKCPDCESTFSRREYVERHRRLKHLGSRPFACEDCGHSFARSDLLKRHQRTCTSVPAAAPEILPAESGVNAFTPSILGLGSILPPNLIGPARGGSSTAQSASPSGGSASSTNSPNGTTPGDSSTSPSSLGDDSTSPPTLSLPTPTMSAGSGVAEQHPGMLRNGAGTLDATLAPTFTGQGMNALCPPHLRNAGFSAQVSQASGMDAMAAPSTSYSHTPDELVVSEVLETLMRSPGPTPAPQAQPQPPLHSQTQPQPSSSQPNTTKFPPSHVWATNNASFPTGEQVAGPGYASFPTSINEFGWGRDPSNYSVPAQSHYSPWMPNHVNPSDATATQERITDGSSNDAVGMSYQQRAAQGETEYSPEAQLLADYFNKGGIGGITALDLGFNYEPSLFPSDLIQAQDSDQWHLTNDKRLYMPRDKYARTYVSGMQVPSLPTLTQYAETAVEELLPNVPIIHPGTFSMAETHNGPGFALTVAGSVIRDQKDDYADIVPEYYNKNESDVADNQSFGDRMLTEKRVHLVKAFNTRFFEFEDKFAALQSMLLYQLLGLFHKEERHRKLAHTFHGSLIMMFKNVELQKLIKERSILNIHPDLEGEELDRTWKAWVEVETWRRVTFTIFLADLETTIFADPPSQPLIALQSLAIDLPASDELWNSATATQWLRTYLSPATAKPLPFLDAIHALLEEGIPSTWSTKGIILAELARLSSFPLLVLSRTMSYLEKSKEVEDHQGGWTLFNGSKDEEKVSQEKERELKRIKRGRERLRSMPGGVLRGGGEGWYEGIKPVVDKNEAIIKELGIEDLVMRVEPRTAKQIKECQSNLGKVW